MFSSTAEKKKLLSYQIIIYTGKVYLTKVKIKKLLILLNFAGYYYKSKYHG